MNTRESPGKVTLFGGSLEHIYFSSIKSNPQIARGRANRRTKSKDKAENRGNGGSLRGPTTIFPLTGGTRDVMGKGGNWGKPRTRVRPKRGLKRTSSNLYRQRFSKQGTHGKENPCRSNDGEKKKKGLFRIVRGEKRRTKSEDKIKRLTL